MKSSFFFFERFFSFFGTFNNVWTWLINIMWTGRLEQTGCCSFSPERDCFFRHFRLALTNRFYANGKQTALPWWQLFQAWGSHGAFVHLKCEMMHRYLWSRHAAVLLGCENYAIVLLYAFIIAILGTGRRSSFLQLKLQFCFRNRKKWSCNPDV